MNIKIIQILLRVLMLFSVGMLGRWPLALVQEFLGVPMQSVLKKFREPHEIRMKRSLRPWCLKTYMFLQADKVLYAKASGLQLTGTGV